MKRTNRLFLSIVTVLCFLVSCGGKKDAAKNNTEQQPEALFAVNTMKIQRSNISDYIKLTGNVQAKTNIQVFPDQNGKISSIAVKIGQSVVQGQRIMEVNPSRPGMIYALSPVIAPISGVITSLPYEIGDTVSMQTPVAKVGNLSRLEVIANVAEKYISKMKVGLNVAIMVDAYPNMPINGNIYEVSPIVDEVSRTLEVKIEPKGANAALLKHGMYANIKIFTENKKDRVVIPSSCIITRYGEQSVFVICNLPTEISNVTISKMLATSTDDEKALILRYFPRILPASFRGDVFETKILRSLEKRNEERTTLLSLYQKDEDNNLYKLKEQGSFNSNCEKAWNIFLELGQVFVLPISKIFKSSISEDEQLRSILIDKGIIEKTTKFVEKRIVRSGIQIDNKTEIIEGLLQDEEIVYSGQSLLENNAKVKIVQLLNIVY
ncbi:MAG: efflux RND transporter periplasmic adaptor subunit [Spirochaetales bacterium]|nr:efflux RND transporter periplasmic adaptor subunit [Spirochaetales bacterium]